MGTISKALNLLNYFSEAAPELGLLDLKRLSGQDKATVHRHLTELQSNGFVEQNAQSRKYRLGSAILRLASVRERTFPVRRIVAACVDGLSADCGELVHASLIGDRGMSSIHHCDSGIGGTRVYFDEADVLPFHATASGLVALAFGDPALRKRVLGSRLAAFTASTPSDPAKLSEAIRACERSGYAHTDETFEAEVSSFAVPFFEKSEFAYGTIAVALPTLRSERADTSQLLKGLWHCAEAVSHGLGGSIPKRVKETWELAA